MTAPAVDCVLDARARAGEGAIWSEARQALYWVDIPAGAINRFEPETGRNTRWEMGRAVGCVAETESGALVAALTDGFFAFDPDSGDLTHLSGPAPQERGHRFNDGTVDHAGRFLAGTMPLAGPSGTDNSGTLLAFDGRAAREVMRGFHTINGLAFSPDGRSAYVSDSFPSVRTIWAYDYDTGKGAWSNGRVFFDTRTVAGRPDGGTIDSEGCYWMAGVGGWQLLRITPGGRVDMDIPMPVERPTRIAFGGRDLSTLYVTSIAVPNDPRQPRSGGIFALTVPGVTGVPMPRMRG